MTRLLHIEASPRGEKSQSSAMARAYIREKLARYPDLVVDTIDLWEEVIPAFEGDKTAAKMTFFGDGTLEGTLKTAWDEVKTVIDRFSAADHYVVSAPMWNGGIPYRLKQYIDVITQPGELFGFDPEKGYFGLLDGKSARLVLTSGVWSESAGPEFGSDFQESYLTWWFRTIGVNDIKVVSFRPSMLQADPAAAYETALDAARSGT